VDTHEAGIYQSDKTIGPESLKFLFGYIRTNVA